ncbi:MAG: GGDEF domain-containing protein [Bryobacteraceae bacterium]|nr:GGDEF domain-containing protein [Bryobacteraceae bacterium]
MERAAVDLTLMRQTEELATFSRYVQLLHRLSTTSYPTLDDLFSEYLATGSQIFRLECGAVLQQTTTGLVPRKVWGTQSSGVLHSLAMEIMDEGDTLVGPLPGKANGSASFRIGTILQTATESFGVLLFWSDNSRETHPQALEMVEMMARGIESAVQQRRLTDELERRARHDGLTGLANRMTLAERLHSAIEDARRDGRSVGVIFMDLDKFKAINDSLGHAAGDAALQEVARRFEQSSGAGVFLARVGGDEFAAVVPEVSTVAQVVETASQLLLCLSEPMFVFGEETHLTASSGVSMFPEDGDDGAALLRKADSAMYEGKQAGGNQIRTAGVPA